MYTYLVLFLFLLIIATSSTSLLGGGGGGCLYDGASEESRNQSQRSELVSVHSTQSTDYLLDLSQIFFDELAAKHLVSEGDKLVNRRYSKSKSLPVKLSEDIC